MGQPSRRDSSVRNPFFCLQGRTVAILIVIPMLAIPALAQEPEELVDPDETSETSESNATEPDTFPIQPSAWCVVRDSKIQEMPDPNPNPDDSPAPDPDPAKMAVEESIPGCDIGVGFPLYRWRRLSWVGLLGQETLGTGVALVLHRPKHGPIPAIGVAVIFPYSSDGISGNEPHLAIGATLAFARRGLRQ